MALVVTTVILFILKVRDHFSGQVVPEINVYDFAVMYKFWPLSLQLLLFL